MIGRELFEPRAPCSVIDGTPDRLHVKSVTGYFFEVGTERFEPGQTRPESCSDTGRDGTAGRRQAKYDSAPAQIATRRCSVDKIPPREPNRPGIRGIFSRHRLHHQGGIRDGTCHRGHVGLVAERILHLTVGNNAVALLQSDDAVAGRRNPRGAATIRRNCKGRDAAGDRDGRSPA